MRDEEEQRAFNKILIPILRKQLPSRMAQKIASVQPMQGSTGGIFKMNIRNTFEHETESWRKKFIFWPKKSIYGKIIVGWINERGIWKWSQEAISGENYTTHQVRTVEYATGKEIFKEILSND